MSDTTENNPTILVILHHSCGDTGKIGQILTELGYRLEIRCAIEGDELPAPGHYAGIVMFGGLMSANDAGTLSGIQREIEWLPSVIADQVPYLGICLGAQLLAKSLGAGVARKPDESVEIGFHSIRPIGKGFNMLPSKGMRFYQWHLEGFSIPKDCERLAESDHFPNQAFQVNDKTIGLQFHPEATRKMIDCWIQREPEHLALRGAQSYKTQIELFRECDEMITTWLNRFLRGWLH
ncbi:MAG: glutamine amidotransferase [Gammaproteobacteria bacterium]|nr:MAG: glutamine amidotransferase [Gammaproteobacteria bacterium]